MATGRQIDPKHTHVLCPTDISITDIILFPPNPAKNPSDTKKYNDVKHKVCARNWTLDGLEHYLSRKGRLPRLYKDRGEYGQRYSLFSRFCCRKPVSDEQRLKNYLNELILTVNKYHLEQNFLPDGKMKADVLHHIVRLVTYEYAFYTKKPLTQIEFTSIVNFIRKISSECQVNLHLVLGSFAVLQEDEDSFNNVMLYVQCGEIPTIKYFNKQHYSEADDPSSIKLYKKYKFAAGSSAELEESKEVKTCSSTPISNNSSFLIWKTAGNARAGNLLDMCLAHKEANAKINFLKTIKENKTVDEDVWPLQFNQLLISNPWIAPLADNVVTGSVTHADPVWGAVYSAPGTSVPIQQKILLNKQSFGAEGSYLAVYERRKMARLKESYSEKIENANMCREDTYGQSGRRMKAV